MHETWFRSFPPNSGPAQGKLNVTNDMYFYFNVFKINDAMAINFHITKHKFKVNSSFLLL